MLNIGIGILTKENEIKIYSISKPNEFDDEVKLTTEQNDSLVEAELISEIKASMNTINNLNIANYPEISNQALVNEEQFYIDLSKLDKNSEFYYLKLGLVKENLIFNSKQIGLKKEELELLDKKNEHIKFWILEEDKRYLILYVNPYNQIIKHKHGINLGDKPTKFDIIYGIVFPNHISAILNKDDHKLSVINVTDFERMFNLKTIRFAKANEVLKKFKKKEYKLGKNNNIEIIFDDSIKLSSSDYGKTRQITYLSSYDPGSTKYKKKNIENAMEHLKEDERLKIKNNKIMVSTPKQFKTFVAILHDSILHRILSDQYEAF